jgi:polysaccharide deacetylase family sporulation protein PdaB
VLVFYVGAKGRVLAFGLALLMLTSFVVAAIGNVAAVGLGNAMGGAAGVGRNAIAAVTSGSRLVPIYSVSREDRVCAITVDATWGDDKTMALLDLFDKHGLKVTFFLAGHWIKSYPDKVREIASRGHELGNHSWTHPHMSALSREKIREELERTQQAIADLAGKRPAVFRPPFGDYSNTVITVAHECGLQTIQWSVDSLDWKDLGAGQIHERVMKRMRPGAIILFHNAGKNSVEALDWIIRDLKTDGYAMLPVSEMLLAGETYVDRSTGEQRSVQPRTPVPGTGGREMPERRPAVDPSGPR